MSFEPPSSSETMWSISEADLWETGASPYACSIACFSDSGTSRIELVWKLDEHNTAVVSPLEYAPGEQRRSGSAPSVQPLVFVRDESSTVEPRLIVPVLLAEEPAFAELPPDELPPIEPGVAGATVVVVAGGEAVVVAVVLVAAVVVVEAGVVVAGAVVVGAVVDGAVVAGVSHCATPPWWEHVPERVCEKLYVPSLQRAVAPGGASRTAADASEKPPSPKPASANSTATRRNLPPL